MGLPAAGRALAWCWQGSRIICPVTNHTAQRFSGQPGALRVRGGAMGRQKVAVLCLPRALGELSGALYSPRCCLRDEKIRQRCRRGVACWLRFGGFERDVTKGQLWALLQQGPTLVTVRHVARELPAEGGRTVESVLAACLHQ